MTFTTQARERPSIVFCILCGCACMVFLFLGMYYGVIVTGGLAALFFFVSCGRKSTMNEANTGGATYPINVDNTAINQYAAELQIQSIGHPQHSTQSPQNPTLPMPQVPHSATIMLYHEELCVSADAPSTSNFNPQQNYGQQPPLYGTCTQYIGSGAVAGPSGLLPNSTDGLPSYEEAIAAKPPGDLHANPYKT